MTTVFDGVWITDAECDEVFKVRQRTLIENVVHDRSNFEHDSELDRSPVDVVVEEKHGRRHGNGRYGTTFRSTMATNDFDHRTGTFSHRAV